MHATEGRRYGFLVSFLSLLYDNEVVGMEHIIDSYEDE